MKELKTLLNKTLDIAARQNKSIQKIVEDQYTLLKGLSMAIQRLSKLEQEYLKTKE